jgi:kynurenine formamidase
MTVRVLALVALLVSGGPVAAATTAPAPAAGAHLDLAAARVVDLSHAYGKETLFWPTKPPQTFDLQVLSHGITPGGFFYAANRFCAPEHGGTHMDAPLHFADGKWSAAEVPVDRLVAPAIVLDVRAKTAADRDYRLQAEDVTAWEARHGQVPRGSIVLLRTGWSERWPDFERYFGAPVGAAATELHFPSFGAAAVELLIARGASAIGVDTASIDHGPSRDFPVHRTTAAANVPGLENLDHLEQLPETGAWIVALPMKVEDGTGGPLRAVALVP